MTEKIEKIKKRIEQLCSSIHIDLPSVATMSDNEIDRRAREILRNNPPERDSDYDPATQALLKRVRAMVAKNDAEAALTRT
jgi:hypothetical protein